MLDIAYGYYNFFGILAVGIVYFLIPIAWARQAILLAASYAIYWAISGRFAFLLFALSTSDYLIAMTMARRPQWRRECVAASIAINLAVLAYFKYANFFLDQFRPLARHIGIADDSILLAIAAPAGISFIVFHSISFVVDCYRGRIKQPISYLSYLLYIAYFPKILSGPITRFSDFEPQVPGLSRIGAAQFTSGAELMVIGAFKKVVIASIFGGYWNELNAMSSGGGPFLVVAAGGCYGLYLLADFSGYTDLARGLSRMLGIELSVNFDQPYAAASVSEFWRRWHMSLSLWLRDYLYFPLGGSQRGPARTIFNLLVTMLLCGLWHGAAWTFVVWGLAHGVVMSLERIGRQTLSRPLLPRIITVLVTWAVLSLTWIVFASPDLRSAWTYIGLALTSPASTTPKVWVLLIVTVVLGPIVSHYGGYVKLGNALRKYRALTALTNYLMLLAILYIVWHGAKMHEFVYFRF